MELHQLRYFLAVARTLSFVRAAEQEGIAQPSVSQGVRKLEADLGVPLFDRLGRSVRLTRYGEALLPHAESILRQSHEAVRALEAVNAADAGSLVVGAIPTLLPYALVEPLAAFRSRFPQAELSVRELTTDGLVSALRAGEIDIALLALPLKHPEIVCSELYREPLVVALPPMHPLADGNAAIALDRLTDERMLLLREGHCLRDEVLTACTRSQVQFRQVFESDHLSSIFAMVAGGFGVSLVPEMAARRGCECALRPVTPASHRRIGYAQAAGHHSTPLQKRFVQWLREWRWGV